MVVDAHVNIWNEEDILPLFYDQLRRVRPGEMSHRADADAIHAAMSNVDRAIVFPISYADTIGIESSNDTCAAAVAKYPDKLIGFCYVDPRRSDYMERLRYAVEELGLVGVKYGPIYNGVHLHDPRMDPVYEYCQRNDLPLTMHMGTTYTQHSPIDLGRPIHADEVAERYPDLKMILAHMGHPWYEDCIAVVRKRPNVYCEVAAIYYRPWQFYNVLVTAEEYRMADKIFFGTDFPFAGVEESMEGIRAVNKIAEGTSLPRVSDETIEGIIDSNPFLHWWHHSDPLRTRG
jgi:predicted TIM-barrel fold metal-dependent hydrolase